MPLRQNAPLDLAEIVALTHALDQDEGRSSAELAEQAKQLAPVLAEESGAEVPRFARAWLEARLDQDEALRSVHERAATGVQLTGVLLTGAGIVFGWAATLGAFYFDGSGRVNAVTVLALLVVLPALLLVPFGVAALPRSVAERVPGLRLIAGLGRVLNAGRLAPLLWRVFPGELRQSLALLRGRTERHQRQYAGLQKWALLRWSQQFALGFQASALAAALVLVVFTDLAFGWSTTLTSGDAQVDAQRVHRIATTLAAPWSWALPEAAPSLELVEQSRYFRAAAAPLSAAEAARLGGWWRFLVLAIAVYGLLPRLLTCALARSRLRAAARALVEASPELSAARRRMHRARIESQALRPEDAPPAGAGGHEASATVASATPVRAVIGWAGAPVPAAAAQLWAEALRYEAGGARTVAEDAATTDAVARSLRGTTDGVVLIVVKGWEPPLMEFLDFVRGLRHALPPAGSVLILPVGLGNEGEGAAAEPAQVKLWRDRAATLGDPGVRVLANSEDVPV